MRSRMKNSELLAYTGSHIDGLEKQHRFLLREYSRPCGCPNCATPLNVFEAAGVSIDDYDMDGPRADDSYSCPKCKRGLIWTLPWPVGGWHWRLVPITVE